MPYVISQKRKIPYIHYIHDSKNLVIICHGFMGHKNSSLNLELHHSLSIEKIDSLSFDFYGHGDSDIDLKEITISECIRDLEEIIHFVEAQYEHIIIVANSFGGLVALCASNLHSKISGLVLRAPLSNGYEKELQQLGQKGIDKRLEEGFIKKMDNDSELLVGSSLLKEMKSYSGYDHAQSIHCPVLIFHGAKDENVPIRQSIKLNRLMPNSVLYIIKNGTHSWKSSEQELIISETIKFIKNSFYNAL